MEVPKALGAIKRWVIIALLPSSSLITISKKIVAWLPAWTCYMLGHWTCMLMQYAKLEFLFEVLYPVYNKLMLWSLRLNDWAGLSLWIDPSDSSKEEQ